MFIFGQRKLDNYSYQQATELRNQLLEKIFRVGPQIVQQQGTGNITTMVLEGISQVENYLQLILAKIMKHVDHSLGDFGFSILLGLDLRSGFIAGFSTDHYFLIILGYAAQSKLKNNTAHFNYCPTTFIDSLRGIDT